MQAELWIVLGVAAVLVLPAYWLAWSIVKTRNWVIREQYLAWERECDQLRDYIERLHETLLDKSNRQHGYERQSRAAEATVRLREAGSSDIFGEDAVRSVAPDNLHTDMTGALAEG